MTLDFQLNNEFDNHLDSRNMSSRQMRGLAHVQPTPLTCLRFLTPPPLLHASASYTAFTS